MFGNADVCRFACFIHVVVTVLLGAISLLANSALPRVYRASTLRDRYRPGHEGAKSVLVSTKEDSSEFFG